MQGAIEPVAGFIAGEHAAGAVGAVGSWGEAKNKEAGGGIAETRNGLPPVVPIAVGAALDAGYVGAMFPQARTEGAGDDFVV
jgi:hypothetical protein